MPIRAFGATTVAARLAELDQQGRLRYLGVADRGGPMTVEIGDRSRELPAPKMVAWLRGWLAASGAQLVAEPTEAPLVEAKRLLVRVTYEDQLRLRVRRNLDESGINLAELARVMDVTKKTIHEALRLGRVGGYLSIFVPFDDEPRVRRDLAEADPAGPVTAAPPDGWREPLAVTRLRLLAYAHQAGVVDWLQPISVSEATSLAHGVVFQLRTNGPAEQVHEVQAEQLELWLVGAADALRPPVADELFTAYQNIDAFPASV